VLQKILSQRAGCPANSRGCRFDDEVAPIVELPRIVHGQDVARPKARCAGHALEAAKACVLIQKVGHRTRFVVQEVLVAAP
jgi:hypothetical protein